MAGPIAAMVGAGGGESNPFANAGADASANFFTGAASARVPILLPPGRPLVTPSLSLGYSSQSGLSSAGFGWSLPIGVLTRSTNRGVPTCDSAQMNSFVVSLAASANELVEASADLYLLKVDEGYTEAIPDRAANTWTVRTREGLTYTFGGDESARVFAGGDVFHEEATCSFTTAWHLTRVEDPNGNQIEVQYEKVGNTPTAILVEYGGNADAGIPHPYRVLIESEAIAPFGKPLMRSFTLGAEQVLSTRLKRIRVEGRERVADDFVQIREYTLEYDDSGETQEFLLASVSATGLPTRRFDYSTSEPTIVDSMSEVVEDAGQLGINRRYGPIMSLMDLNGDGLLDRLCVNSGSWHAAYGDVSALQFAEYEPCDRSPGNWSVPSIPGVNLNRISRIVEGSDRWLTLDLTGDGIPDLVRRLIGQGAIHVYPGSCSSAYQCGFSDQPETWNNPDDGRLRRTSSGNRGVQLLAVLVDMNADGLPDIVRADGDGAWTVFQNTGAGFDTAPVLYPDVDDLISYTSYDGVDAAYERALIDLNSDGLPDWVAAPSHSNSLNSSRRMPHVYFAVVPGGELEGPFALEDEVYLCPNGSGTTQAVICDGGAALPAGWALVGAVAVRLNTGTGFSDPVYSPAPIWRNGNRSASRLRGTWEDSSAKLTRTYRDFVDVNGDGRVDWVSSGYGYDGSDDWFVLFNRGDGRFGGGLEIFGAAFNETLGGGGLGANLGEVRPTSILPAVGDFLGRSFAHTEPGDRSDLHATVLDIDADGLAERVRTFGSSSGDRWEVKAFRFEDEQGEQLRPRLLQRVHDGVGGVTHFQYAPSSIFVGDPSDVPRLPFVSWVVTGLRETDGLCDQPPTDWFTLVGNPCLAEGHEQVQQIEYSGGLFDTDSREFRGFGTVDVIEGPASIGSLRRHRYLQDDAYRGKRASVEVYVGGIDLLSRTSFEWGSVADGPRTQIFVQEQRVEEFVLYSQYEGALAPYSDRCVVHRSSIFNEAGLPDPQTRVRSACSMACAGAGPDASSCDPELIGKKQVETAYADPDLSSTAHAPIWDRPAWVTTSYVDESGASVLLGEVEYTYDALASGQVGRGNLTRERQRTSASADSWTERLFDYDEGASAGPGNITSMEVPLTPAREPTRFEFEGDFQLFVTAENAAMTMSANGQPVQQRIQRETDFRNGLVRRTVGVHGEAAGDVSGVLYDDQGRPLCAFEPGTSCVGGGFPGSSESRYVYGTPGASKLLERLNSVEVRRREPNAPNGYLVTRSYFDALGREHLTTNQQGVAGAFGGERGFIKTVVVRHFEYGSHGWMVRRFEPYVTNAPSVTPPAGTVATLYDYALNGNASGHFDPAGRIHQTKHFDGATPKKFFFGDVVRMIGGLESSSSAGNHVVERLDEHGRSTIRRLFDGSGPLVLAEFAWRYDGRDQVVEEWFGGDASTRVEKVYDLLGRLVETKDPNSGSWRRTYDAAGNTRFADDPISGQSVQSCYDALDRVILQCARAADAYDPNLCASSEPECTESFSYFYDETEPLTSTVTDELIPNWGTGQLTRVEGPDSKHAFTYDIRRQRTARIDQVVGVEATTQFSYSADLGRLQGMVYPDGERVVYGYDQAGHPRSLSEVDENGVSRASYVTGIAYDLRGRPIRIRRGNYTEDVLDYHGPNERFRLARIRSQGIASYPGAAARVFFDLRYADYDGNQRILKLHDAIEESGPHSMSAVYAYDGAGRLETVSGPNREAFEYDSAGNMTRMNGRMIASEHHRLIRIDDGPAPGGSGTLMNYDANGRRLSKVNIDAGQSQTYAYGPFGRMRRIAVGGVAKIMGYDHLGMRVSEWRGGSLRRVFGASSELKEGQLTKYYRVGDQLMATRTDAAPNLASNPSAVRLELPPEVYWAVISSAMVLLCLPAGRRRRGLGGRLAASQGIGAVLIPLAASLPLALPLVFATGCVGNASIRHYHMSHLGSPVAITRAGGEVDRAYRYSAFGEVRRFDEQGSPTGIDPQSAKEFAGYETDPDSGLQYAGARFYDPEAAQFLSPDPAEQFANPYAYAGWDPVNLIDPDGRTGIDWMAYGLVIVALALALANAVTKAVMTGSAGVFFQEFGIGVASVFVGYMSGFLTVSQPAATLVLNLGASTYGVVAAKSRDDKIFAGIGLLTTLVSSAFGFYRGGSGAGSGGASGTSGAVSSPGRNESHEALGGVLTAGREDANIASIPGRALVRLNNNRIESQIATSLQDLRGRALAGEFGGLDVAAFEVRTTRFERDLGVKRLVSGSVNVVARPPGTAGFPHALAPSVSISPVGTVTTVSAPILIRSETATNLLPASLSEMLFERGIQ